MIIHQPPIFVTSTHWQCPDCNRMNELDIEQCSCGFHVESRQMLLTESGEFLQNINAWVCPQCKTVIPAAVFNCECGAQKKE